MLGDDETKQHAPRDPENIFFEVEFDAIRLGLCKGLLKVGNEVVSLFGLNYDVIDVGLNGPPDEDPKHLSMQRWYIAPAFFRPNNIKT